MYLSGLHDIHQCDFTLGSHGLDLGTLHHDFVLEISQQREHVYTCTASVAKATVASVTTEIHIRYAGDDG